MIVPYVHFDCDPTAGAKDVPKKPDGKSCPVSCLVPCPDWSTQRSSRNNCRAAEGGHGRLAEGLLEDICLKCSGKCDLIFYY